MAQVNLYIDITQGKAVKSLTDTSVAVLPRFIQGDSIGFKVYIIQSAGTLVTPTRVPVSGITLQVAIGTRVGNSSTHYAEQGSWTASTDLADPYWEADLALNTVDVNSLIGSTSSAQAWFEVQMIEGTPTTILQEQIDVRAAVTKSGDLVVPAGLTPLSAEAAAATYLTHDIAGPFRITQNGRTVEFSVDADGTFHADTIS